jgi:hypothetical protein
MDYRTVQYSTVQCITVQYIAVQCITVQYSTVQCITVQYSAVQYNAMQYSTKLLIQTSARMGFVADKAPVEQVVPRILRLSHASVIPSILPTHSTTTNAKQIQQLIASLHNTLNKLNIVHRLS